MSRNFTSQYKRQKLEALELALKFFDSSPAKLARAVGSDRREVYKWRECQQLPKRAARALGAMPSFPLTKEEIRPDIKIWD